MISPPPRAAYRNCSGSSTTTGMLSTPPTALLPVPPPPPHPPPSPPVPPSSSLPSLNPHSCWEAATTREGEQKIKYLKAVLRQEAQRPRRLAKALEKKGMMVWARGGYPRARREGRRGGVNVLAAAGFTGLAPRPSCCSEYVLRLLFG